MIRRLVALVVALALAGAACSAGDGGASPLHGASPRDTTDGGATIDWSAPDAGGFESATLAVPLDHDDPDGPQIPLALVRRPAEDPSARIGSLLVNPGGPGASGIEWARQASLVFSGEVLERFDIVGWDPRGVGESAAVACLDGPRLDALNALDPLPDSPEEAEALDAATTELVEACEANTPDGLLEHVSTVESARDMDRVRAAVGDDALTYVGWSYGTELGTAYAELFPDRVRALVLDGAVPPDLSEAEVAVAQGAGFEQALNDFLAWCEGSELCRFPGPRDPGEALDQILAGIDAEPLAPVSPADGRPVTIGYALTAIAAALYAEEAWPALAQALAQAERGEGRTLMLLADTYNGREPDGTYSNLFAAYYAVQCLDRAPMSEAERARVAERLEVLAPRMGALALGSDVCEEWPVEARPARGPVAAEGAPPILVITTTGDPATPYQWGLQLAEQLTSGVLVVNDGAGHTAYGQGDPCIDAIVERYLIDLEVPEYGTACP